MPKLHLKFNKYVILLLVAFSIPLIAYALLWLANDIYSRINSFPTQEYGVTFSPIYTKNLGLPTEKVYTEMLDELKVKRVRLPVYWTIIEPTQGAIDYSQFDRLLDLSASRHVKVILVVGYKLPRWPECFAPDWTNQLPQDQFQDKILNMVQTTVNRYKNRSEIIAWQVENEPQLKFGDCRRYDEKFLSQEISLVRSLDTRPIFITESGELGQWQTTLKIADQMGVSVYRYGWDPVFGFHSYPIPPIFYQIKYHLTRLLYNLPDKKVYIAELQTEPWTAGTSIPHTPINEQIQLFDVGRFKEVVDYVRLTNFTPSYLWGVEWWYYMREQGHPEYWEYAKTIFSTTQPGKDVNYSAMK